MVVGMDNISRMFRDRRMQLFFKLINSVKSSGKVKVLDVGGTEKFWRMFDKSKLDNIDLTIFNISNNGVKGSDFKFVKGDARNMKRFKDKSFDVVFSNSLIEHVGNFDEQKKVAREIRRVGKRYFIQTPNYYFPIEPHFLFPFFHFLPISARIWLIRHFSLGFMKRNVKRKEAESEIKSIRLLKERELIELFPGSKIYKEKFMGFTKSFVVYGGF